MELELVNALLFCAAVFCSSLILMPLLCWLLLQPTPPLSEGLVPQDLD